MKHFLYRRAILLLLACGTATAAPREEEPGIQWRKFSSPPLVLYCHDADVHAAGRILGQARKEMTRLAALFSIEVKDDILLIVAASEKEFDAVTQNQLPEWSTGAASPVENTVYLKSPRLLNPSFSMDEILAHELCHILVSMAAGGRDVERWFDEGLAEVLSRKLRVGEVLDLARNTAAGELHSLEDINGVLGFDRRAAGLAYLEAFSAVEYFILTHGNAAVGGILSALGNGLDMDQAMLSVTGSDIGEFESSWKAGLERRFRWAVLMDYRAVSGLVLVLLFFLAVAAARIRACRRKKEWREEEPGEDETAENVE